VSGYIRIITMKIGICLVFGFAVFANVLAQNGFQQRLPNRDEENSRIARQTSADQMVQNILQWLQGVYAQNSRRIRQGQFREYLPPTNTQKPSPFKPPNGDDDNFIGYPQPGDTPRPSFNEGEKPTRYPEAKPFMKATTTPEYSTGYPDSSTPRPGYTYNPPSSTYYPPPTYTPPQSTYGPPSTYEPPQSTYGPPQSTYGPPTTVPPGYTTGYPTRPTVPSTTEEDCTDGQEQEQQEQDQEQEQQGQDQEQEQKIDQEQEQQEQTKGQKQVEDVTLPVEFDRTKDQKQEEDTDVKFTSRPEITGTTTERGTNGELKATDAPSESDKINTDTAGVQAEDDDAHPPHIHEITVECSKEMMLINIEFNRAFNGIIYSKGYYTNPDCRYVSENSNDKAFSFTVSLNSCGTEFVNAFDTQGQSYLENVLVLQNEAGIQEVWDTIRAVRCLWEGNLKKELSVALNVGMLSQEIVTFSGDTAMAKLDIQMGKDPFGPPANGLIKIGEPMTLVVSVSGDPGFDIQVKDCRARDSSGNTVALSDQDGCILKPKLFGAFQKTRNTGNTGANIMSYAYFNAFKFPDVTDLMIECNVELCKTDCEVCPDPNKKIDPGRRKRETVFRNDTLGQPVTMGKALKVILPEDLALGNEEIVSIDDVCVSRLSFIASGIVLVLLLAITALLSANLYLKRQHCLIHHKY